MNFELFQEHTVKLYNLRNHPYIIQKVNARELLSVYRFDLFAKLFYACHRDENSELAREVYLKHIKAFNPDGKEPGRSDKHSFNDFIQTYDRLLDYFKDHDFDASRSVVPVSSDGIILDGAHRVAALAYYDKEVTIARFEDVVPVCQFDYYYFRQRGLIQEICDIIAKEVILWKKGCYVACLWPRMGNDHQKVLAKNLISEHGTIFYTKTFTVSFESFRTFIGYIYRMEPWVGTEQNDFEGIRKKSKHCYVKGNKMEFCFFYSEESISEITDLKEEIRNLYFWGKHSIHITDNNDETAEIASYVLDYNGLEKWAFKGDNKRFQLIKMYLAEQFYIMKNVRLIRLKTYIANRICKYLLR